MRAVAAPFVVLVLEDDAFIRGDIVNAFKDNGWTVLDHASGEAALEGLNGRRVDALFTDIQLAGKMDGWDVAQALRKTSPDLPVVYASGNTADRRRRVAGSLFFDKPYLPADIVSACFRLVERGRAGGSGVRVNATGSPF